MAGINKHKRLAGLLTVAALAALVGGCGVDGAWDIDEVRLMPIKSVSQSGFAAVTMLMNGKSMYLWLDVNFRKKPDVSYLKSLRVEGSKNCGLVCVLGEGRKLTLVFEVSIKPPDLGWDTNTDLVLKSPDHEETFRTPSAASRSPSERNEE